MAGLDPKTYLNWLARNRWVILGVLLVLLWLVGVTVAHLFPRPPALGSVTLKTTPRTQGQLIEKAELLLVGGNFTRLLPGTNAVSPFATDFFKPPPPPTNAPVLPATNAPPPIPPPPPPQKIAFLYQGMMETSSGLRLAYLRVDNALLTLTNGAGVAGGFVLSDFTLRTATLQKTNETNVLHFSQPAVIEVPAN